MSPASRPDLHERAPRPQPEQPGPHRGAHAGALHDHVDPPRAGLLLDGRHVGRIIETARLEAEPGGDLEAVAIGPGADHHHPAAGEARDLGRQQPDGTRTGHQDTVTGLDHARIGQRVADTGQRLHEGRGVVIQPVRQTVQLVGRRDHEGGEAAIDPGTHGQALLAEHRPGGPAGFAVAAGVEGGLGRHQGAHPAGIDTGPDGIHDPGDLVAQGDRRPRPIVAVQDVQVRAAHAGGGDRQADLAGTRFGHRDLVQGQGRGLGAALAQGEHQRPGSRPAPWARPMVVTGPSLNTA